MGYENFTTGFNKPAIFTAQTYGTKTTVEIDHSDLDLNEVMEAFQTLIIGMGYSNDALKHWVLERADEYNEDAKETIPFDEEERKVIEDYVANLPEDYIDDALAKHNSDEEDFEYNDYGMRVNKTKK
jgi:hypothetical protein